MSKDIIVEELHKPARRNFLRRATIIKGIDDLWQADLIDMKKYSTSNKGFKYILVVIDTLSKFAWTIPVKSKAKDDIVKAMHTILMISARSPSHLQTDLGKEFYNAPFQKLIKKYGIKHYSTFSTKKASIVERLIRTLKNKLFKYFSLKGKYEWLGNNLDLAVKSYNSSIHHTTKFKPVDVNESNEYIVKSNIYSSQLKKLTPKAKYRVGDQVRISKYKSDFYKGYTPNWSTEIFKIVKINRSNPITYHLKDKNNEHILGTFYEHELQKTKCPEVYLIEKVIKRKGNKLYIKWLGLNEKENSWINVNDLT